MIYLDNAATTSVDSRVADLVLSLMIEDFGNSGSRTHEFGVAAARHVAVARGRVAKSVNAQVDEVIFTSGATESNNLAILGLAAQGDATGRRHVVSTMIEHKAVLEPLDRLAAMGFDIDLVAPDYQGHVSPTAVLERVRNDTLLVSVMHANNETGAVQPINRIANGLHASVLMHVDAAQTYGKLNGELSDPRLDLISVSGHKIHGPKGIGALIARRRDGDRPPLRSLMAGGGQERGLRPGAVPVPLVAGLGLAAELADREAAQRLEACRTMRREALAAMAGLGGRIHGDPERGVMPNILSIAIPGIDSEAFMVALKDLVAISNGSACTSSSYEPSHVLTAMGLDDHESSETVRFSWAYNTPPVPWEEVVARLDDLRL